MAGDKDTIKEIIDQADPDQFLWLEWDAHEKMIYLYDLSADTGCVLDPAVRIPRDKLEPLIEALQKIARELPL